MNTQHTQDFFNQLSALFPANRVKFRAGATNKEKTRAQALAYIDARDVMERLDMVVTPAGWSDSYQIVRQTPAGVEVECALTIGEITKRDVGTGEDCKAAYSDAFKRAAVKFGIGRYLYDFPRVWVDYDEKRKALTVTPSLPAWAVPAGEKSTKATPAVEQQPAPTPPAAAAVVAEPTPAVVVEAPAEQGIQNLFVKITRPQQQRFHALGRAVYGVDWDSKRAELVKWYTNGRIDSSRDLTRAEADSLIAKLVKKAEELGVPAYKMQDANDVLF
jgi:hypothetical protein